MSRECVLDEVVTKFFLNTCRLYPQPSKYAVEAAVRCIYIATRRSSRDAESDLIPLITGSVAEFYIEPMLPHIGDIDIMYHHSTQLAIPRGHPPPTQLPAEFHNYVKVHEIVDSHLPGYVYLQLRYLLTEYTDDDTYSYYEYDRGMYLVNVVGGCDERINMHGPALLTDYSDSSSMLSIDVVPCVRCLSWPSQAADWPTRHRNYDWPDSATIDHVVSTDVTWLVWHIVSVEMRGWASISTDYHSPEQKMF